MVVEVEVVMVVVVSINKKITVLPSKDLNVTIVSQLFIRGVNFPAS